MTGQRTLAVVDKQDETTVVWHVQTDPDAAAILTGAWLSEEPASLLEGTVQIPVGDTLVDARSTSLDAIYHAILADIEALKKAAAREKESNPSLTLPRFEAPAEPDVAAQAEAFRGEDIAREAWAHAVCAAQLVDSWHAIESKRKLRKYLAAEFGSTVRELPLG